MVPRLLEQVLATDPDRTRLGRRSCGEAARDAAAGARVWMRRCGDLVRQLLRTDAAAAQGLGGCCPSGCR
jgi:hypothetical protein